MTLVRAEPHAHFINAESCLFKCECGEVMSHTLSTGR
jgi:hypothetical protein